MNRIGIEIRFDKVRRQAFADGKSGNRVRRADIEIGDLDAAFEEQFDLEVTYAV